MRVKMVTVAAGPMGVLQAGQEYEVGDVLGGALVKAGAAVKVLEPEQRAPRAAQKKEAAEASSAVETAAEAPERETATLRKGKGEEKRKVLPKVMGG